MRVTVRGRLIVLPVLALLALAARTRDDVTIVEVEPNNTVATAKKVDPNSQAGGVLNPAGDVDNWAVDLLQGDFFSADVDARSADNPLDATLQLIAPDGTTSLAFNDDFDGLDPRISYRIPASGRYTVQVRAFGNTGSPAQTYTLNLGFVTCGQVGTEVEPDNSFRTAARLDLDRTASGELCAADDTPTGDVDYWAFTAEAGTTIELDVDAAALGVFGDSFLALYGPDGITRLTSNDDSDGSDSRLQFSVTTTGTYFAAVSAMPEPGGGQSPFRYNLHLRAIASGPGDPIAIRADELGLLLGIAAGPNGDFYVGDVTGNRIVRVNAQGVASPFAAGIASPEGLAFDAFGNLLAVSGDGIVYRITPEGQATRFLADAGIPVWVAVGPDGRIWLSDLSDRSLRRYSPAGQFEARFDVSSVGQSGPGPLAVGPSGEPHFSNGTEIWKLADGVPRRVAALPFVVWGFAFDAAGNIYAPSPPAGRIVRIDPTGTTVVNPLAVGPDAPEALAFGRDAAGATTARLFATDQRVGQLIELNPAGVLAPGLPVGFRAPAFTKDVAVARLLGGPGLSAAELQYLDAVGNQNGRYDVGDFRAYLITLGAVPGAARQSGSHP